MVKRQILFGMFALASLLFPSSWVSAGTTSPASMDGKRVDVSKRNQEMEKLEKQQGFVKQDQQTILDQIEEKKAALHTFDQKVYQSQERVDQGKKKVTQLEVEMAKNKELFKKRMRTLYLQGSNFYIEQLLHSSTFGNFLTRLDYIHLMIQRDQELLKQYQEDYQQLLVVQNRLKRDLAALQQQQTKANQQYKELQSKYTEHERTIAKYQSVLEELAEENQAVYQEIAASIAKASQQEREDSLQKGLLDPLSNRKLSWPIDHGRLTSLFGRRYHPIRKQYRMHEGIDIAAKMGEPIRAVAAGEVIEARPSNGYGYIIVVYHREGLSTLYAHMYAQTVKVKKGQMVKKGEVMAAVGNNGQTTGPHLHLEVYEHEKVVDPLNYYR
jgi:murein DD-endopeptidase MepM/ murein hydrolase activator NlpD